MIRLYLLNLQIRAFIIEPYREDKCSFLNSWPSDNVAIVSSYIHKDPLSRCAFFRAGAEFLVDIEADDGGQIHDSFTSETNISFHIERSGKAGSSAPLPKQNAQHPV